MLKLTNHYVASKHRSNYLLNHLHMKYILK